MALDPYALLERIRLQKPVVHHLTNWVTIYDCAQVCKTLGASPVMAHAIEEVAEMARIASALVLNIGTLTPEFVEAMKAAARSANANGIPVVLDACGAGATTLRDQKSLELIEQARIDIIKGNVSEIGRLSGAAVRTKGVDAGEGGDAALFSQKLARERKATVVVTGATDIVTDGRRTFRVSNGHEMMSRVVGTGCMAASVIGTFAAVERDYTAASASALACYGIAGQLAAENSPGPARFKERLFDVLFTLDRPTIERLQRITCDEH